MNAGTTNTPSVSGIDSASSPISAAVVDDPEPVSQPLDRRACDEHRSLERVDERLRSAVFPEVPRDRGKYSVVGLGALRPRLRSTKLPVPFVTFAMPGLKHA